MFEFRRVKLEEKQELKQLQDSIYNNLERKEFFMPYTDEVIDMMFDNNKIIAYGAYHGGKLVGTAQLYLDEMFVSEVREKLDLKDIKIADLGGSLVLSEYRQNGIMTSLATILIQEAKRRNIEKLIITVHPENIASNNTFLRLGAQKVMVTNFGEYERNVYIIDLTKRAR